VNERNAPHLVHDPRRAGSYPAAVAAAASASRRLPPAAIALALALLWLGLGPRTPDLAAAVYRSSLFARDGFQLWDNAWYGGHHLAGYSIDFPALGSAIGVRRGPAGIWSRRWRGCGAGRSSCS
jgi:hypothetical protein